MSEERSLVSVSDAWMEAIATNRVADIEPYMADEWLLVTPEAGPVAKRQFLDAIARGDLAHDDMCSLDKPFVRIYGNTAVLVSRVQNHGGIRAGHLPPTNGRPTLSSGRTMDGAACSRL